MRLTGVETFAVAPPDGRGGRVWVFVELTTDDGLVGVGEAYGASVPPTILCSVIEDCFARHLDGRTPFEIERFVHRAYGQGFTLRPDVTLAGAVSALELACWDLVGQAVGQPVHQLLGGRLRDSLRTYTYLYPAGDAGEDAAAVYTDPAAAGAAAADAVDRGFTAVKLDPAGPYTVMGGHHPWPEDLDHLVAMVAAVREAVGSRADVLVGTHGQFTATAALRAARRLEPYDPLWFEEPVPPDDEVGMARVCAGSAIPVAAGERLTGTAEFARLVRAGVGFVQPNLGRCGGLLEGKKIAAIAATEGVSVAPHLYCGPVVAAANAHLAAGIANFAVLECIDDLSGFHRDVVHEPLHWEAGQLLVPDRPGLGIRLDHDVVRAHAAAGDALHLEMWTEPIDVLGPGTPGRT